MAPIMPPTEMLQQDGGVMNMYTQPDFTSDDDPVITNFSNCGSLELGQR
jgi:hypothetical protein